MSRKYLELFKEGFPSDIDVKTSIENKPYVGYSSTGGGMVYTVVPKPVVSGPWVTFTAEEDNSSIGLARLSTGQIMEYSINTTTWNTFDTSINISLNNGDKVYVRGILSSNNDDEGNYTQFTMSGKIAASGNCNALWNYQDLNAPLKDYCGANMFNWCKSLTTAPELPATTLAIGCYYSMFSGCTSLTTAPELPAAILVNWCYGNMFSMCSSLNTIICLATDISAISCTGGWVYGITNENGTFIKHPDMNSWTTGPNDIPNGWEVVDAEL